MTLLSTCFLWNIQLFFNTSVCHQRHVMTLCSKFLRTGRAIIKSFHAGSVGGIDIACPQHILDMTTSIETVTALFIIASKFVITLPRGDHRDIISIFSMKVSLSLEKISGMRPKTFGYILSKIVAKYANNFASSLLVISTLFKVFFLSRYQNLCFCVHSK